MLAPPSQNEVILSALDCDGFAHVGAPIMASLLADQGLADWQGFAASWDDLGVDGYMADGGRYRRRRHAAFSVSTGAIKRKPHQPHYQSRDYNALNGGLARWFEPILPEIGAHPAMMAILRASFGWFHGATPAALRPRSWHVELHQFRIEAQAGAVGKPTPEGMHRDGVDWVCVLLVRRENVASGVTSILDVARRPLGSFTLAAPMEAALVNDERCYHGVTPVTPVDGSKPAYRDVLVATFRRE